MGGPKLEEVVTVKERPQKRANLVKLWFWTVKNNFCCLSHHSGILLWQLSKLVPKEKMAVDKVSRMIGVWRRGARGARRALTVSCDLVYSSEMEDLMEDFGAGEHYDPTDFYFFVKE